MSYICGESGRLAGVKGGSCMVVGVKLHSLLIYRRAHFCFFGKNLGSVFCLLGGIQIFVCVYVCLYVRESFLLQRSCFFFVVSWIAHRQI